MGDSQQDSLAYMMHSIVGDTVGQSVGDVELPQYYREGFFSHDTLFHPELPGGRYGEWGTPIPYSVGGDDLMTTLLLCCFLTTVFAIAVTRRYLSGQADSFLYIRHEGTTEQSMTSAELRFQLTQTVITCVLLSSLAYFLTIRFVGESLALPSNYYLIAIYVGAFIGYFLLKMLLYTVVNLVFFDGKRNLQWQKSFLFVSSLEGILIFPAVISLFYINISVAIVAVYLGVVLIIVKLLSIYKTYLIFFRTIGSKLQIILYLCALEIVPMLTFAGALLLLAESLNIKN